MNAHHEAELNGRLPHEKNAQLMLTFSSAPHLSSVNTRMSTRLTNDVPVQDHTLSLRQRQEAWSSSLESDIVNNIAETFENKEAYKEFLQSQDILAKIQLDFLQTVLFYVEPFSALWKHGTVALQRLAVRTGVFPSMYELEGVQKLEEEAVSGGSFGEVYRGIYAGKQVCIKMLRVNQKDRNEVMKFYAQEAILWGQLSHRNILPFYGLCTLDFRPCLISPWAANGNVTDYLKNNPHVNRLALVQDVTEGLHYLHSREIVHGDLKGGNVLVDSLGYACLADFGVSSVCDRRILDWTSQSAAASTGGTIRWQAPELLQDEARNTKQSDMYAWGCTCYEIFTSERPYADTNVASVITLQKMGGVLPSDPSRRTQAWVDAGLNDEIWSLLFGSWDPRPEARPTIEDVQPEIGWRLAVPDA